MASFTTIPSQEMGSDASDVSHSHSRTHQSQNPSPTARRADRERVRVSRACDRCKAKKIRCTGKKPCALCSRLNLDCQFNARYTRGRIPPIESEHSPLQYGRSPHEDLHGSFDVPPTPSSNDRSNPSHRQNMRTAVPVPVPVPIPVPVSEPEPVSPVNSSRASPAPSQTDLQNHYVGPSSGVSFLLRVQKRLHKVVTLSPRSSIFTFGDTPLPEFDSSFFVLPPKEYARTLIARYFDFAVPTHRFLHRPSLEGYLEELYSHLGVMLDRKGERGKRALLFMVFAQAQEYMPHVSGEDSDCSARYFQAAEHQLRAEMGEIRLTSVQARLCQCFYLLSESRINHCWSLFGTTAHLLLALGIHRKLKWENSKHYDMIDFECRKRVFWAAYTLDNYLSAALGRPRTFHDEDIDQEMPSLVSDEEITSSRIITTPSKSQSIMLAPMYHARLGQLISGILKDLYGIRPLRRDIRISLAKKHHSELIRWREGIAHFLDVEASLLNELFQRQSNVLRLAYAHALLLVHRPFLLTNFENLTRRDSNSKLNDSGAEENVRQCLAAAMSIVAIVNDICESGQMFRAFFFTQYYAFCAVVILYVYTIQHRVDSDPAWNSYFQAAKKCQGQITSYAKEKDSFAQRYSIVLEELRSEAVKQSEHQTMEKQTKSENEHESDHDTEVARTILRLSDNNHIDSFAGSRSDHYRNANTMSNTGGVTQSQTHIPPNYNAFENFHQTLPQGHGSGQFAHNIAGSSPATFTGDATGWGDFDSFVTAGVGAQEAPYLIEADTLNGVDQWHFTGLHSGMYGGNRV